LNYPFDEYVGDIDIGVYTTTNASLTVDFDSTLTNNPVYGFEFEVLEVVNPLE